MKRSSSCRVIVEVLVLGLLVVVYKIILDGLKRNMSRGNSLSDELDLSSVPGDTRAYLYSSVLRSFVLKRRKVTRVREDIHA